MRCFAYGLAALVSMLSLAGRGQSIEVDFQNNAGVIRPLHGVNGGPLCYRGTVDLSAYHRALRIPSTRLHDVPWVNAEAVDIHIVFPDLRADPEKAENYRFAATDDYIAAITNVQSQIVFRLGESIEHTPQKYFVHPPADPARWAAVCLGIIRHYNQGWANGFRHGIRYWEIWNEPENRPAMWTGSEEQYFALYATTAKTIKAAFPEVNVGGPAVGATGDFDGETFKPVDFVRKFLAYCRGHEAPLDFFSWHRYTSQPWDLPRRARAIRRLLDEYGFLRAESHLNEWNYLPDDDWGPLTKGGQGQLREDWYLKMGGPAGAAFAACGLILLQDAPVDVANFYTGEIQGFGLFNYQGLPKKSYYAFKAFAEMLETGTRVETRGTVAGELAVLAGIDLKGKRVAVLVSRMRASNSPSAGTVRIDLINRPWTGGARYEIRFVDATHDLGVVGQGIVGPDERSIAVGLKAPEVALLTLKWESESGQ